VAVKSGAGSPIRITVPTKLTATTDASNGTLASPPKKKEPRRIRGSRVGRSGTRESSLPLLPSGSGGVHDPTLPDHKRRGWDSKAPLAGSDTLSRDVSTDIPGTSQEPPDRTGDDAHPACHTVTRDAGAEEIARALEAALAAWRETGDGRRLGAALRAVLGVLVEA
jgi:hypothetical protein